jgi:hypothetical protein
MDARTELEQLKTAVQFLIGLLEEGSLVPAYHQATREEIADVLRFLMPKVEALPDGVPFNLVQSTAVRAIVEASALRSAGQEKREEDELERQRREAAVAARIHGHELGEWEQVPNAMMDFQATCAKCGGFVYISHGTTFNLLLDSCERLKTAVG